MLKIIVQRLLFSVITLTIVAVVVFAMTDLLPGDWAQAYFGKWATEEGLAALREEHGLDRPATERFAEWLGNALRGDFGDSLSRKKPVVELISFRLRNSLLLGGLATTVHDTIGDCVGHHRWLQARPSAGCHHLDGFDRGDEHARICYRHPVNLDP